MWVVLLLTVAVCVLASDLVDMILNPEAVDTSSLFSGDLLGPDRRMALTDATLWAALVRQRFLKDGAASGSTPSSPRASPQTVPGGHRSVSPPVDATDHRGNPLARLFRRQSSASPWNKVRESHAQFAANRPRLQSTLAFYHAAGLCPPLSTADDASLNMMLRAADRVQRDTFKDIPQKVRKQVTPAFRLFDTEKPTQHPFVAQTVNSCNVKLQYVNFDEKKKNPTYSFGFDGARPDQSKVLYKQGDDGRVDMHVLAFFRILNDLLPDHSRLVLFDVLPLVSAGHEDQALIRPIPYAIPLYDAAQNADYSLPQAPDPKDGPRPRSHSTGSMQGEHAAVAAASVAQERRLRRRQTGSSSAAAAAAGGDAGYSIPQNAIPGAPIGPRGRSAAVRRLPRRRSTITDPSSSVSVLRRPSLGSGVAAVLGAYLLDLDDRYNRNYMFVTRKESVPYQHLISSIAMIDLGDVMLQRRLETYRSQKKSVPTQPRLFPERAFWEVMFSSEDNVFSTECVDSFKEALHNAYTAIEKRQEGLIRGARVLFDGLPEHTGITSDMVEETLQSKFNPTAQLIKLAAYGIQSASRSFIDYNPPEEGSAGWHLLESLVDAWIESMQHPPPTSRRVRSEYEDVE